MPEGSPPTNPYYTPEALKELAGLYVWKMVQAGTLTPVDAARRGFDATWATSALPMGAGERRTFFRMHAPPIERVFGNPTEIGPHSLQAIQAGDPQALTEPTFLPAEAMQRTPGRVGWRPPPEEEPEPLPPPSPKSLSGGMMPGALLPPIAAAGHRFLAGQGEMRERQQRDLREAALAQARRSPAYRRGHAETLQAHREQPGWTAPLQGGAIGAAEEARHRFREGYFTQPQQEESPLSFRPPSSADLRIGSIAARQKSPFRTKEEALEFSETLGQREAAEFLARQGPEAQFLRAAKLSQAAPSAQERATKRLRAMFGPEGEEE